MSTEEEKLICGLLKSIFKRAQRKEQLPDEFFKEYCITHNINTAISNAIDNVTKRVVDEYISTSNDILSNKYTPNIDNTNTGRDVNVRLSDDIVNDGYTDEECKMIKEFISQKDKITSNYNLYSESLNKFNSKLLEEFKEYLSGLKKEEFREIFSTIVDTCYISYNNAIYYNGVLLNNFGCMKESINQAYLLYEPDF